MFNCHKYSGMPVVFPCLFSLKSKNSHVITQFKIEYHCFTNPVCSSILS